MESTPAWVPGGAVASSTCARAQGTRTNSCISPSQHHPITAWSPTTHKQEQVQHVKWWRPGARLATTNQQRCASVEALWDSVQQRGFESVEHSLRDMHAMQAVKKFTRSTNVSLKEGADDHKGPSSYKELYCQGAVLLQTQRNQLVGVFSFLGGATFFIAGFHSMHVLDTCKCCIQHPGAREQACCSVQQATGNRQRCYHSTGLVTAFQKEMCASINKVHI